MPDLQALVDAELRRRLAVLGIPAPPGIEPAGPSPAERHVAAHESCHVVVGELCAVHCESVELTETGGRVMRDRLLPGEEDLEAMGRLIASGEIVLPDPEEAERNARAFADKVTRRMVATLAGPVYDAESNLRAAWWCGRQDLRLAWRYAEAIEPVDRRRREALYRRCWPIARTGLQQARPLVDGLAERLLRDRLIVGDEIEGWLSQDALALSSKILFSRYFLEEPE